MAPTACTNISQIRREIYHTGELPRADGTMLEIVPHTPHPEDGDLLRDIAGRCAPQTSIEIGCATGLSTLALFEGLIRDACPSAHTVVDPYFSGYWGRAAELLMSRAGVREHVKIDERESVVVLAEWLSQERTCDFAFIDGSHWFECALSDIALLARIIRPGGTMLVDDPWMPAVADAVSYAVSNLNCTHARTYERNGKPRLVELEIGPIARDRAWDSYIPPRARG